MAFFLYDIFLHAALPALLPYFFFKMIFYGKYRSGIFERFGFIKKAKIETLRGKTVVWVHAVSVGETKAALPLVKILKERNPFIRVVFSTVTATGNAVAKQEGASFIDALIYFPLDFGWVVRRVVRSVTPSLFVAVEKEFWPNLLMTLDENSVPVIVVNGVLSERSAKGYKKLAFLFGRAFGSISFFCAMTKQDAVRAAALGIKENRIAVSGNLKFDTRPPELSPVAKDSIRKSLGISGSVPVIVAGSTHRGEEDILLAAFGRLKKEFLGLKLVLAPRHPERFDEVEAAVIKKGFSCRRKKKDMGKGPEADVALLDTIGELASVYSISTIAFVGGTLVPIGGHNLLEPAFFGIPVVYGPHLQNCLQMAEALEAGGASARVSAESVEREFGRLLQDESLRAKMGSAGKRVVKSNRGAIEMSCNVMERYLSGAPKK
ncbi:MAG TPA: 3-deoxy-D-manno-octulosonic acid transferase [Thermodesulfobacteriota bacterium]|nr:3-deoxy-D-manno-octulosonic acid transferase [Thermodesulfobacteriota bacterium]